ncbi:MAG: acyl-CoA reductase [Halieaceae bacterium]|nr:acyl-CoA reductase [Halieaceae bacterium]
MSSVSAPFFIQGRLCSGAVQHHKSRDLGVEFVTPKLDLNAVVTPRSVVPPLLNTPLSEIIDFLVETGNSLRDPANPHIQACFERMAATHMLPREVLEVTLAHATAYLDKRILLAEVEQNFPDPRVLDQWVPKQDFTGRQSFVRAFGPRLVHVMPGNSPGVAIKSIAQGAMVKAINLFKMSSSDPFTMVAILQTMAEIDPDHPVVQSMTAAYWRGGDATIESALYRPQYFDKLVAWGGGDAINNVAQYIGPGFQLVSFDPKTSISMVGSEAFSSPDATAQAADLAAADLMILNQEACAASRYQFVEGTQEQVDEFCRLMQLGIAKRAQISGDNRPVDVDIREQIEMLTLMDDDYRYFGDFDGAGVVIRSEEPVDFHPINKIGNVVRVDHLDDAVRYVNVATQTIGFFPFGRIESYRDRLAAGGAQRITHLGEAGPATIGNPHDAMYPMHRFVHWMAHEDGAIANEQ